MNLAIRTAMLLVATTVLMTSVTSCTENAGVKPSDIAAFHKALMTIDSHVDIPREYMRQSKFDPGKKTVLKVDFSKMRAGGLDVVFFVVYVGQKQRDQAGYDAAYEAAMKKFEALQMMADAYPDEIAIAYSASDVKKISAAGKLVAIIGVENGFPLAKDLSRLEQFYALGARYLGLTHTGHNDICDSSGIKPNLGDQETEHGGVSDFGKQVIQRMNHLGMMIDISHAADSCVEQTLKLSRAPIIASHSGARALLDHPRNLNDQLLKGIGDKGGVIQLVGYSGFIKLDPERSAAYARMKEKIALTYQAQTFDYKLHEYTPEYAAGLVQLNKDFPLATVAQYVDQIEHVIKVAGIDHVGISSDFDGGGELNGWHDASESENITRELLKRGYNQRDIQKIWGANLLRVWVKIEQLAGQ